eukprot:Skav208768  [mRNA]  locus=scaffold4121:60975:61909:- [translate_table: standard]
MRTHGGASVENALLFWSCSCQQTGQWQAIGSQLTCCEAGGRHMQRWRCRGRRVAAFFAAAVHRAGGVHGEIQRLVLDAKLQGARVPARAT